MRLMRFWSRGSRSASTRDKLLKVFGDFAEQFGGKTSAHAHCAGEDSRQDAAKVTESNGAIDPPRRFRCNEMLCRQIGRQGIEVVTHHLGADVLAGGQPSQARHVLKIQTMLEALEGLLNAPAAVVKIGECGRGIALVIEQGGHQHAHFACWRHLTNQAYGRCLAGALVVDGVLAIWRRQRHHIFIQAGAHELGDGRKGRGRVTAHAEWNSPVAQGGDQPGSRITAIQYQHVLTAKAIETLEQHLPLTNQRAVQNQRIKQLDAWTKQAEQGGLADATLSIPVKQSQANLGSVGGQNPKALPKRLSGNALVDQAQQFIVERIEDIGKEPAARFRESAGGDHATQAGSPVQQGKEGIQLDLHRPADTGEQEDDQIGEGQIAVTSEMPRVPASRFQETGAMDKGREPRKYVDIFRPSYLAYKYQLVSAHITPKVGSSPRAAMKYAKTLSHED
jgi:hypothetical protein